MFTKGEWRTDNAHGVSTENGGLIVEAVQDGYTIVVARILAHKEAEANAQLIASSPDTAEALRDLISFLIHDGLGTNVNLVPIINRGTKALKKAGIPI